MSSRTTHLRLAAAGVALLTVAGIVAAPARATRRPLVETLLGRYIVTLRDSVGDPGAVATRQSGLLGGTVEHVFSTALKGYSASLPGAVISKLLADPLVAAVEPDARVALGAVQVGAPAGLDRVDQRALPLSGSYTYTSGGQGVRAYVIDSGVKADHPEFTGRVAPGFNVMNRTADTSDCFGHGTHVAGILGSSSYGVAKGVSIVPVRAFGCDGSAPLSAIVAAIDWATADHRPGQPAVANLSLTGPPSAVLDRAVAALSNDGVAVAVAAGNDGRDSCATSPGRVTRVVTVAASDAADVMAPFSNGGQCVDLFAPGVAILSTDSRSNGTRLLSGTSMATPYVTGALAVQMAVRGTTAPQAQNRVVARATPGVVTGTAQRCILLSGCRPVTANNRLLFTGA